MSDKTMDTEPGGEGGQYEGQVLNETSAPKTQSGQLGSSSDTTSEPSNTASQERGEKTAENVRYGQNISESGMGGMTNQTGSASQEGGYGGAAKDEAQEEVGSAETRSAQGYGGGKDMDREVGA